MPERTHIRRLAALLIAALAYVAPAQAGTPATPLTQDPMGPISDVTADWEDYQPADVFCIKPEAYEFTGDQELNADGSDPACMASGWTGHTAKNLYRVDLSKVGSPPADRRPPKLCPGCRRIFIDFSKIPATNSSPYFYARGHAYYHVGSPFNHTYTADPYAHSPNTKNFTNDKLVVPEGSTQYPFVYAMDMHDISYVTDTVHFEHAKSQGPWYVGPEYFTATGRWVRGVYIDVDVVSAQSFGSPTLDAIGYQAGFNDGENLCGPDPFTHTTDYTDGNYFYGSCFNHFGFSSSGVEPFSETG